MHAIESLRREELVRFVSLGDDPHALRRARARASSASATRPITRSRARRCAGSSTATASISRGRSATTCSRTIAGRTSTRARARASRTRPARCSRETVAFIESLPFVEIGRAVIFGLEPNDHAPPHRDSEPGRRCTSRSRSRSSPRGDKRFYLRTDERDEPLVVDARAYWFNDMDYHGVLRRPVLPLLGPRRRRVRAGVRGAATGPRGAWALEERCWAAQESSLAVA